MERVENMRWFFIGITTFIGLIIYITGIFIQKETTKGVFFGVRTPEGFLRRDDLKRLEKEYKKRWSIVWFGSIIITNLCIIFLDSIFSPGIMIIYSLVLVVLLNFCYYKTHKKVKEIKAKENWSEHFVNNRIVVVDLKKEEQEKNYNKLFVIPIILIIISIILNIIFYMNSSDNLALHMNSSGIVDRWAKKGSFGAIFETVILIPLVSTFFTMFFWGMNKIIYRAKNQINGGEVNLIMEQKRQFRKAGSWIFVICNIQTVLIMSVINIMLFSNKCPNVLFYLLTILGGLLPIIIIIYYSYKVGQGGANVKVKGRIEGNSLIINRDDDENYVWGSMYYNKEDPALFVEKRIGFGWDLNWGNKKAKWFMAPIVAILIFVIFMIFYELPNTMKPRIIDINDDSVRIEGSYGETINRNNIEKISLEDMPKKIYKTNGASIDNKHYGNYKITYKNMSVKAKLYIENDEEKVIVIETKDGKLYLINKSNIEDTNKLYNKMK